MLDESLDPRPSLDEYLAGLCPSSVDCECSGINALLATVWDDEVDPRTCAADVLHWVARAGSDAP